MVNVTGWIGWSMRQFSWPRDNSYSDVNCEFLGGVTSFPDGNGNLVKKWPGSMKYPRLPPHSGTFGTKQSAQSRRGALTVHSDCSNHRAVSLVVMCYWSGCC